MMEVYMDKPFTDYESSDREFDIVITETAKITVTVEAKDREEARRIVSDNWKNGEYVIDAEKFTGVDFSEPVAVGETISESDAGQRRLYLLYSCNVWCEKSKATLILITSDQDTLHTAIAGEILTGGMEYDGQSGGRGFSDFKRDYLNHNIVMDKLKYGYVEEMAEMLLSEPDFMFESHKAAIEFLDANFDFDPAAFDHAYSGEDAPHNSEPKEDENDIEI
jgi:hypothetical protein